MTFRCKERDPSLYQAPDPHPGRLQSRAVTAWLKLSRLVGFWQSFQAPIWHSRLYIGCLWFGWGWGLMSSKCEAATSIQRANSFCPGKSSYKKQPHPPPTLSIKYCLCNSNNPHCWQVLTKLFNITVPGARAEGHWKHRIVFSLSNKTMELILFCSHFGWNTRCFPWSLKSSRPHQSCAYSISFIHDNFIEDYCRFYSQWEVIWEGHKQRSPGNTGGGISPNCIWHFTFIFLAIQRCRVSNPVVNNNVKMLMAPGKPSESTAEEV